MKYLVIVESPAKINKIQGFLPKNYQVLASYGHIKDLDSRNMSIDFDNEFKPTYVYYPKAKQSNYRLMKAFEGCECLIIATDLDREGEFIGESLIDLLHPKKYERIVFNEISKNAVLNAIKNPVPLSQLKLDAQKTRRFMDRIFGYGLSGVLDRIPGIGNSKKLGCGRVQSMFVKFIVDQDDKVNKALNETQLLTFEGTGQMSIDETIIDTWLTNDKGKRLKLQSNRISALLSLNLVTCAPLYTWLIESIKDSYRSRAPKAPYTTASLQIDASNKLGWSVKKVMETAQRLYENGYITYMRSDAVTLSEEALLACESTITKMYGKDFHNRKQYESQQESAQEAHEAIRPTNFDLDTSVLEKDQYRLFDLIWKRTISSQMANSKMTVRTYTFAPYTFIKREFRMVGSASTYTFKGYTIVYDNNEYENDDCDGVENICKELPTKNIKNIVLKKMIIKEHPKSIPSRYTESKLVKAITDAGIGRPGTTASFLSKILDKDYVRMKNTDGIPIKTLQICYDETTDEKIEAKIVTIYVGAEKNRLIPTELGKLVNDFLEKNFSQVMDINFTVKMEQHLSNIISGNEKWLDVMNEFYNTLKPQIDTVMAKYGISVKTYKNDNIVGKYKGYPIFYVNNKIGTSVMVNLDGKKIWANTKVLPTESEAIKLIEDRLHKPTSRVIREVTQNYIIKESSRGLFLQLIRGKKMRFSSLQNMNPSDVTEHYCDQIAKKLFK